MNRVLSIMGTVLVVHVTLVKPKVNENSDGINIIMGLKVQNHRKFSELTPNIVLHGLSFQTFKNMLRQGRT